MLSAPELPSIASAAISLAPSPVTYATGMGVAGGGGPEPVVEPPPLLVVTGGSVPPPPPPQEARQAVRAITATLHASRARSRGFVTLVIRSVSPRTAPMYRPYRQLSYRS